MTELAEVSCPKCKHAWKQAIHASVNVTLDPSLKARLVRGELFRLQCPSCGTITPAPHDLLYQDVARRLLVHLTSPQDLEAKKAALPQAADYTLRIVHGVHDLNEKIFVFDAELNDGIVEMLKIMLRSQLPELQDADLRFQALDDTGALAFAVLRPGARPEFRAVPREFYDLARGPSFPPLEQVANTKGDWLLIDRALALREMQAKSASEKPPS